MSQPSVSGLRLRLLSTALVILVTLFAAIYLLNQIRPFIADSAVRASFALCLLALLGFQAAVELLVLCPVRKMGAAIEQRNSGAPGPLPEISGRGELSELARACQRMADLLEQEKTERRQTGQRLLESERLNRVILSSLPANIAILDRQGTIVAVNEAWERFACDHFGEGADHNNRIFSLIRSNYVKVCQVAAESPSAESESARAALTGIKAVLSGRQTEFRMEYPAVLPTEIRWFLMIATPLPEDLGGAVVAHFDITDRKRAEEQRYALETQLFQSQRMESIGTLAGGIAHDFNNILTAIIGNIQLLRRRLEPGSRAFEYLRDIDSAASRAASLTRQLLSFSRRQQLERTAVNVNDLISNLMNMLRRIIGEDIEISVRAAEDLLLVSADVSQLEQVLVNLAVNARDAMPGGGQMVIETRRVSLSEFHRKTHPWLRPGNYVQIAITDTGCGMDAETQQRAFEPFFTTKGPGEGTGLGLSVAYGIIKQHDGFIHLYSEPEVGTTFRIYLPPAETGAEIQAPEKTQTVLTGGTETILVAEDEDSLRKLAYDVLTGLGYTILLASDGIEAVELYQAHRDRISLLLLDIVMPRQGGRATFEAIREMGSSVPVIFMTGYSAEIARSRFITTSRAAILQKPYTPESLGLKVREILNETKENPSSLIRPALPGDH
jgi:signal transduction histidine kinase/ActR/RegA family two-component response regulator